MTRWPFAAVTGVLILSGLTLRLVPWGLPLSVHHFGGGILWGAMLFTLTAALRPTRFGRLECAMAAALIIISVEGSRHLHGPNLDAFRLTLAGQLLLGRIFSQWNIMVDGFGVAAAFFATRHFPWRTSRTSDHLQDAPRGEKRRPCRRRNHL